MSLVRERFYHLNGISHPEREETVSDALMSAPEFARSGEPLEPAPERELLEFTDDGPSDEDLDDLERAGLVHQ